ncbi:hypothetical protein [Methanothrix sp.]|uniref:hypothetical protein n=1 Tax=Methanothrix sp. TaxID=90426 RepID=UPI003D28FC35
MILLMVSPVALSLRYTAEETKELDRIVYGISEQKSAVKAVPAASPSISISSGTTARTIERQYYQAGDPIKINKVVYLCPGRRFYSDDGYYPGDTLVVFTELIPATSDEIKGLWIHENIDRGLYVQNISRIYEVLTGGDLSICQNSASDGIFEINETDYENSFKFSYDPKKHLITFGDLRLQKPSRLLYWYAVKPNDTRKYNIKTTLRFYDVSFADMDYSTEIDINPPEPLFEVGANINQKDISKNDIVRIIYDISYLGGMGNRTQNITVVFEDTDYCEYVDQNKFENVSLDHNEVINIEEYLKFNKSGMFSLPAITIISDDYLFKKRFHFKDDEIVVKDFWERWGNHILLALSIFGIILGPIYGAIKDELWKTRVKYIIIFILLMVLILMVIIVKHT